MIVGSNERRYAWMDEGFNTYQNAFSNERRMPGTDAFPGYVANWRQAVDDGTQSPLMTPPDRIDAAALGAIGYRKPGATLLALRDNVVGRETMDRAMREYARRWAFKHPTPGDFFRTVENVSGEDLSWFWNSFFYGTSVLDIALDGVSMRQVGGESVAEIHLRRVTSVPFPGDDAAQVQRRIDAGCEAAGRDLDANRPLHGRDSRQPPGRRRATLARSARARLELRRTTPGAIRRLADRPAASTAGGIVHADSAEPNSGRSAVRRQGNRPDGSDGPSDG